MTPSQKSEIRNPKSAFTLVEMLVVMAIIGVLAALVLGGMTRAKSARERSRVKAELNQIMTAIDSYKQKLGFYPPDNPNNPARPPLFYELTGTLRTGAAQFTSLVAGDEEEKLDKGAINSAFGRPGFANSSTERDQVFNFAKNLKSQQYYELADIPGDVEVLVCPVDGPVMDTGRDKINKNKTRPINTWRYVSTNPTNNANGFDLWAEIKIGNKTEIIGNW